MADISLEQVMGALRKADAAGDMDGARRLAQMARELQGASGAPSVPQAPQAPEAQPESGYMAAIANSVTNELPSSLAGGAAALARTAGFDGASKDLEAIKARNDAESKAEYVRDSSVAPTVREGFKREGFTGAAKAIGTGVAEGVGTAVPGLVMGVAKRFPISAAVLAVPNGAIILDGIREEKRAKGLDPELNGQDYMAAAIQLGIDTVPFGGSFIGKAATEGVKEVGQDAVSMANAKTQGATYTADEVTDRAIDAGTIGAATKAGFDVATGTARGAVNVPLGVVQTARSKSAYQADPEQARVDLMAMDALRGRQEAMGNFKPGREEAPNEHVFTAVSDDYKRELESLRDTLLESGTIDKDARNIISAAIRTASSTKRDLAVGGLPSAYLETELDQVKGLNIPEDAKKALVDSLSVLNTVSHNRFSNRKSGPLQQFGKKYGAYLAAGAGGAALGPMGIVAGMAGPAIGSKIGAAGDRLLGLQELPVVKRAKRVEEYAGQLGVMRGDGTGSLKDAISEANTKRLDVKAQYQAKVDANNARIKGLEDDFKTSRSDLRAKDIIPPGGFDKVLHEQLGLRPKEVDKGLTELLARGRISQDAIDAFNNDPRSLMEGKQGLTISNRLAELVHEGVIKRDPALVPQSPAPSAPQGAPGGPSGASQGQARIFNPLAYEAAARGSQARETASYEKVLNGSYSDDVKAFAAAIVSKPKSERKLHLKTFLNGLPVADRAAAKAALEPLTEFGKPDPRP